MRLTDPIRGSMDFESCRFDFRIDSKNGLTPSKRKKTERKSVNNFTLFKCKVCGCLFDSRPALLEHKVCHNKFKCVFCEARFPRQTWMMDHVALVHGAGGTAADADADVDVDESADGKGSRCSPPLPARKCADGVAVGGGGAPPPSEETDPESAPSTRAAATVLSPTSALCAGLPPPPPPPLPSPLPSPPLLPPPLDAPPRSPNPLPLPPTHGLPVSSPPPAAVPRSPGPYHGLTTKPRHFTPPLPEPPLPLPPLPLPPLPMPKRSVSASTTSATPPHLHPSASAAAVPCFYISLPVLISSGNSVNDITASLPSSSSSSPLSPLLSSSSSSSPIATAVSVVTDGSAPTVANHAATAASLLPVNPFTRKDVPARLPIGGALLSPHTSGSPVQRFLYPEAGFAETGMDHPRQAGDRGGVVCAFDGRKPAGNGLPSSTDRDPALGEADQTDQTEALDFSLKTDGSRSRPSGDGGSVKPVFSLGFNDPGETLRTSASQCEGAVDLSVRSSSDANHDDRVAMRQEYPDQNKPDLPTGRDEGLSLQTQQSLARTPKCGTKRRSSFLDKMVQKLWESKISRREDRPEGDNPVTPDFHIKTENPEEETAADEGNTSLGRVYVLNQLPEQIDTYTPGYGLGGGTVDLSIKKEAEIKEARGGERVVETMSDDVLHTAAPSIGGAAVLEDVAPKKNEDRGFCAIKFHTCRVCKQLFYSAEEMWEHAVTHEDFHKYKCNQCAYVTACHRELVNHKLVNHGLDMQKHGRHVCTHAGCMRSYSDWRHLKDHQKVHEHQEAAAKVCSSKNASETLIGSPTKDGRLMCDFAGCYKTFKEWRHLKVHQTLHTGEKPLSCQLCSYACRHRSSMNWHMKSKHGLDKMKTQGNRTVYVDSNRRVVCGWSDEANREVNYLKETQNELRNVSGPGSFGHKAPKRDGDGVSDYSTVTDDAPLHSTGSSPVAGASVTPAEGSSSASVTSSRSPSCAPSDNPSERSLVDDPHVLMLKMQSKPSEFPLNMSVQIEDLSPKEQVVGADGKITSKTSEDSSDRLSERLTIDVSPERDYASANGANSPSYEPSSTVSSGVSSSEAPSAVGSEGRTLVMTPVAMANLGQGSDHQASMMKFKLKYLVAPKFFPCKVCSENFDSATKMWEHRIREHRHVTQFYCDSCSFFTDKMNELQGHMLSTHGKEMGGLKDHVCFICGKGYATRTGLNQHLLRHSEDGPPHYECPYENCASKVHSKCALKNHIRRVHLKVPAKYRCPEDGCQRRFDSSSALRNHQVLHTEHRPLVCDFNGCDKSFRESKHLKVHRMQHTDEKPIKCELCDYSCRQRNSMNWHMKSKHNCEKSVSADGRTVLAKTSDCRLTLSQGLANSPL